MFDYLKQFISCFIEAQKGQWLAFAVVGATITWMIISWTIFDWKYNRFNPRNWKRNQPGFYFRQRLQEGATFEELWREQEYRFQTNGTTYFFELLLLRLTMDETKESSDQP